MFLPRATALLALGLISVFAGCSGGGSLPSTNALIQPANVSSRGLQSSTVAQTTIVTGALATKRLAGPIVALGANGAFEIQAPVGIGMTWIYPTATTSKFYQSLQPALNEYAIVTATGTSYAPTAISVYRAAPSSVTFTGSISSQQGYGVTVKDNATGAYIPVALSSSSSISVALSVGATVTIKGPGVIAPSAAVFADSITASGAAAPAATATPAPAPAGTSSAFMSSSWGKISAFQIFDETGNGTITSAAAAADGNRYSSVWGVRPGLGPTWRTSNASLQSSYYMLMDTDQSTTGWGAIGHTLAWWQANHPSWVLYECSNTTNAPTTLPAYDSGLPNVPLDIRNPAVVNYQIAQQAIPYALKNGYTTLGIDEATFWFPGGGHGYYPCGTWNNGTFTREYANANDYATWAADVVKWVKAAHALTQANHLKLLVNHPGAAINTNEAALLTNVDAVMDETGFTDYGQVTKTPASFIVREIAWMKYAQAHGTAVLINQDWGSTAMGASQKDYSIATYLLGNEQAASLFASSHTGYGVENYYPEYGTAIGAPCGEYYTGSSSALLYRKFANALVVVNAGGSGTLSAALPSGHTYSDIEGRAVSSTLSIASNDGYVLKTTNGCQ